ncbi:MAG: hypothetical protein A3A86_05295 [Elusimicrobia bacterium RIFCSPLOWO2_01_FULL_60_11]|nr:MAG: hypothetical protein A3A86_05295 [Elusimicrobia bacterium RIFCSPLOWO2_01_FULL_60_11]
MKYPEIPQSQISEMKTRLQAILFSIEDGIVMTDFEGNISILNDSAKKLLGIEKKFPYELKFLDYVADAGVKGKLKEILASPQEQQTEEILAPGKDKEKCLLVTKSTVTTAKGEVLGKVLAFRDISRERDLEKLKDDFVHSITHDLKSPLTSIQGYLDLFLSGEIEPLTPTQIKHMEVMNHSTRKLLKMINNLLDMAKIEAGHLILEKGPWDPVNSVTQILTELHAVSWLIKIGLKASVTRMKDGKKTTAQVFPAPAGQALPEITLMADGNLMDRAISNLVDNALKHTPQGGSIEVHIEEEPRKIIVSVRDSGEGIPPEALEKIFQKFQQLSGTKGGTGLGLTFARETVERHGGRIMAASEPGKGATFTLWVPK